MRGERLDGGRGKRIALAMNRRGHHKAMALAAELQVSPAAMTKWKQGHAMSLENACRLADVLDVSLDWLLLGRSAPDWVQHDQLNENEAHLIESLRCRPKHIASMILDLVAEVPPTPPKGRLAAN